MIGLTGALLGFAKARGGRRRQQNAHRQCARTPESMIGRINLPQALRSAREAGKGRGGRRLDLVSPLTILSRPLRADPETTGEPDPRSAEGAMPFGSETPATR